MAETRCIKLVIAYEGTNYRGWQRQPNAQTVQETIERALGDIIGRSVRLYGASRTDAGVHAEGQVANFTTDSPIPDHAFAWVLNGRLPPEIVVRSSERVNLDFHASRDAMYKTYLYRIYTAGPRDVQQFRRRWHFPYRLDIEAMDQAAGFVLGTHDFRAFASAKDARENTVRTVLAARTFRPGQHEVDFEITADRFLYHMVRNITGTLAEIGRGRWPPEKIAAILASRDRTHAGPTAPAHGLCLMKVEYHKNSIPPT